jgi:nitrate/nitrite transporter NarK
LIHDLAPKAWGSTLQGIMNALAFGLAQLISRPAGGALYDSIGPSATFLAAGLTVLLGAALLGSGGRLARTSYAEMTPQTTGD